MAIYNRKEFLKTIFGAGGLAILNSFIPTIWATKSDSEDVSDLENSVMDAEWENTRELFPLKKSINYFNTAGLGASPRSVLKAVSDKLNTYEIDAVDGRKEEKESKSVLAKFLGTEPENLAFTRNTTEGINIIARELNFQEGDEIISTKHEHVGGASPLLMLEKEKAVKLKIVDLDLNGSQNFELIKSQINSKTKLICISHVCCTTGLVLPIKQIAEYCKSRSVLLCVDGAQAIGSIWVDLKELDVDFYVGSGHKWLFGPKGTGFLYVNQRSYSQLKPNFAGAYAVESFNLKSHETKFVNNISRVEYGTRNSPLIKGLEAALKFHEALDYKKELARNQMLADYFRDELSKIKKIEILSPSIKEFRSPIVSFKLIGMDFNELRNLLLKKYHHRLRAIYENDLNALRVCVAIYNDKKQLDQLVLDLQEVSEGN